MRILADKHVRQFFCAIVLSMAFFLAISQCLLWIAYGACSYVLLVVFLLMTGSILLVCYLYFYRQNKILEAAVLQINSYLDGNTNARIDCDYEGELYRLFHSVNMLAAVLDAHALKELEGREFLKNTISDISHQLKTPLAALNIYNGLLQGEAKDLPAVKEYVMLSEQELDRIEVLVHNLLKIAKLDAGSIVFEKISENVADMMKDVELHFIHRAKTEQKKIILSGAEDIFLICDRDWLEEAIDNIVKNALDHTRCGDCIYIEWKTFISVVQITIKDNGRGICPEDLPYIFKRFYRSSISRDTQGTGLGLPIAKGVIEAHGGTIEVDSVLERGTAFVLNFPF